MQTIHDFISITDVSLLLLLSLSMPTASLMCIKSPLIHFIIAPSLHDPKAQSLLSIHDLS